MGSRTKTTTREEMGDGNQRRFHTHLSSMSRRKDKVEKTGHDCPKWTVLWSLRQVYGAKRVTGWTIIDAPPFFESEVREELSGPSSLWLKRGPLRPKVRTTQLSSGVITRDRWSWSGMVYPPGEEDDTSQMTSGRRFAIGTWRFGSPSLEGDIHWKV